MSGSGIFGDHECDSSSERKLVVVGRTGNGKSATGNSILGKNAFKSARLSSGVTHTCELEKTRVMDHWVTVIDTPGFGLDSNSDFEMGEEIAEFFSWSKDNIHAVVVVLSTCSHFSDEEDGTIRSLTKLFGPMVSKYMIIVFTGGDEIPSLLDYLGTDCPDTLKNFISHCGGRVVLFDNKTLDENKKARQVRELLFLVECVLGQNGGQPLRNFWFGEPKRLNEEIGELEEQLAVAHRARFSAEQKASEAQMKLKDEIAKLKEKLREEQAMRPEAEENLQKIYDRLHWK